MQTIILIVMLVAVIYLIIKDTKNIWKQNG